MIEKAVIIPTGEEIKNGVVLDTDSPMIMQELVKLYQGCQVLRINPLSDDEEVIGEKIKSYSKTADLVILIGGSGGGHRFSKTLSNDFTHSALEHVLDIKFSTEIYGKNGHLWSKLYCGKLENAIVINVPGPYDEAYAAIKAFCSVYKSDENKLEDINTAMTEAVIKQYGSNR